MTTDMWYFYIIVALIKCLFFGNRSFKIGFVYLYGSATELSAFVFFNLKIDKMYLMAPYLSQENSRLNIRFNLVS